MTWADVMSEGERKRKRGREMQTVKLNVKVKVVVADEFVLSGIHFEFQTLCDWISCIVLFDL